MTISFSFAPLPLSQAPTPEPPPANPLQAVGGTIEKVVQFFTEQGQNKFPELGIQTSAARVQSYLDKFGRVSAPQAHPVAKPKPAGVGVKVGQYLAEHGKASGQVGVGEENFVNLKGQVLHEGAMWAGLARGEIEKRTDSLAATDSVKVAGELGRFSGEVDVDHEVETMRLSDPVLSGKVGRQQLEKSLTVLDESGLYGRVGHGIESRRAEVQNGPQDPARSSHLLRQVGLKKKTYDLDAKYDVKKTADGKDKTLTLSGSRKLGEQFRVGVDLEQLRKERSEQEDETINLQRLTLGHQSGAYGKALQAQKGSHLNYLGEVGVKRDHVSASVQHNFNTRNTQVLVHFDSHPKKKPEGFLS